MQQGAIQRQDSTPAAGSPGLRPLEFIMHSCAQQDEMHQNVDATLARGYQSIIPYLGSQKGACSIVGAAPSLRKTYHHLRNLPGDIIAINSSLRFLLERGIVPKWAMLWDAAEIVAEFLSLARHATPHPDITYLVAARCHPYVFEKLRGCKVVTWFAAGDYDIDDYMRKKGINDPAIKGGSAGVTRAMYLMATLGYTHQNIFGADSSYSDNNASHVNGSLVNEKTLKVWVGNGHGRRMFSATPEWCEQVNEFRDTYQLFRHPMFNMTVDVYGDGMLPHMAGLMKAKEAAGKLWNPDGTPHPSTITPEKQKAEADYIKANPQLLEKGKEHGSDARQ